MSRQQAAILNFYGFRAFKPYGRAVLGAEITRLVQSHLKPKLIFSRALDVLVREKVELPGYFPLAALILTATPLRARSRSAIHANSCRRRRTNQEMAEACKRLIKNCINCWNCLYLSQKLAEIR
jgi:hypothetical protein